MIERVRVAEVNLLINVVHEFVWYNLQKVEVIMSWVLRAVFKFIIDFAIFHEHVEDCVLTMVNTTKCMHNHFLLTFITECNGIHSMIHLQFELFIFRFMFVLGPKYAERFWVTFLSEMQLSCHFWNVEGAINFALHALFEEICNLFWSVVLIIKVKFGKGFLLIVLLQDILVRVNVRPSQVIDDLVWL